MKNFYKKIELDIDKATIKRYHKRRRKYNFIGAGAGGTEEGGLGLIYQKRSDRGVTYVYSSESYYVPEKKQSRSKRKLIGKVDPETGEIVPTGKSGRKKAETTSDGMSRKRRDPWKSQEGVDVEALNERLEAQEKEIDLLRNRISILESDNEKLRTDKEKADALLKRQRRQLEDIAGEAVSMAGKMKEVLSIK